MSKGLALIAAALLFASGLSLSPTAAAAMACAKGYHLDAHGHCQPNNPSPPRHDCPPHFYAHVAPNGKGYRCKSYP